MRSHFYRRTKIRSIALIFSATLCLPIVESRAQDQNNPDQLKKQLADLTSQLKSAQDRKNELANENDKLKSDLAAAKSQLDGLLRDSADWANRTYELRSEHAAWMAFLSTNPNLRARWELVLEAGPLDPELAAPAWPATRPISTEPATKPAPVVQPTKPPGITHAPARSSPNVDATPPSTARSSAAASAGVVK